MIPTLRLTGGNIQVCYLGRPGEVRGVPVIRFRRFHNTDPPALADLWNECFANRGAYPVRNLFPLERGIFSKPYFDPDGLIIAEDKGLLIGFVHVGFGPNDAETALDTRKGVVCAIGVSPPYRRAQLGTELLGLAEKYLTEQGAETIFAGQSPPHNPFYFGLYGGSNLPGFLTSDAAAGPFLENNRYDGRQTTLVFNRRLDQPVATADPRFPTHRRRYDVQIMPRASVGSWWQESVFGLLDPLEVRLEEKGTGQPAARALVWEMEGFSWRWNSPAAGVIDLVVRPELRRQGLARFLITQLLKYLQEQFFVFCEVQAPELNHAAVGLLRGLGFTQEDVGRVYQKVPARAEKTDERPPS